MGNSTVESAAKEYRGVQRLVGPLLILERAKGVGYQELVEVRTPSGETRRGTVIFTSEQHVIVQVFEGTRGLSASETRVRFAGEPLKLPVSEEMLGRILSGAGRPLDGGPPPYSSDRRDVNGLPVNPSRRAYPREVIQTGVSAIDGMNTLVRGQKLPIFSGSGLPHNELAAQILAQSSIEGEENFAVVFAGMGIKNDDAHFFREHFRASGVANHSTMFLNLASDPPEERIITPRCALTLAEFLAFDAGMHVMVMLLDMTNYCEALRELSSAREEVPSRKGYPGYMYTDLAGLYERTGRLRGRPGSITQLPILSMPSMDITHPVPDLTGYITEGQIVLSQELQQKGIYPPIDVLPSLSRLMKDGIGEDSTRADHAHLSAQLYAAYAQSKRIRSLAAIIGEEELTELDAAHLHFGDEFEQEFVAQRRDENRSFEQTLDLGWRLLRKLPRSALTRVTEDELDRFHDEQPEFGEGASS